MIENVENIFSTTDNSIQSKIETEFSESSLKLNMEEVKAISNISNNSQKKNFDIFEPVSKNILKEMKRMDPISQISEENNKQNFQKNISIDSIEKVENFANIVLESDSPKNDIIQKSNQKKLSNVQQSEQNNQGKN